MYVTDDRTEQDVIKDCEFRKVFEEINQSLKESLNKHTYIMWKEKLKEVEKRNEEYCRNLQ